jgi:hypothetical protein
MIERLDHERWSGGLAVFERLARQLQHDDGVNQSLLRSIVQVANHAPSLGVGGRHGTRSRRRQFRPRLDIRDRRGDQLGERLDAPLRVHGQQPRLPRDGDHRAPQPSVDHDRCADGRAGASRPPASMDQRRDVRRAGLAVAPARDDADRLIGFVADHRRGPDAQEKSEILREPCEHLVRRRLARDEGHLAPQRGLLSLGAGA